MADDPLLAEKIKTLGRDPLAPLGAQRGSAARSAPEPGAMRAPGGQRLAELAAAGRSRRCRSPASASISVRGPLGGRRLAVDDHAPLPLELAQPPATRASPVIVS